MAEKCEKVPYRTRGVARRARKRLGDALLRPYRCHSCAGAPWHLGHLSHAIRAGVSSRAEVYGRRDDRQR